MSSRWAKAVAVVTTAVVAAVVVSAGRASAHVSVSPTQAAQGGFAVLTFRVPNERETAKTTKIQLYFPTTTPIIGATVRQTAGWTGQVVRGPLPAPVVVNGTTLSQAVTSITWTAKDDTSAIGGSDYQEFGVSVGPLPTTDRVVFKALQTYDDGQLTRWIEEPAEGQPEPEPPAVVLHLTAAGEKLDAHGMPISDGGQASGTALGARDAGTSPVPLVVAVAALVVAVAALLLALIGRQPRRKRPDV